MEPVIIKNIGGVVRFGFSGKKLGDMRLNSPAAGTNLRRFTAEFPGKTVYDMPAVGKDVIADVDGISPEELWESEADSLITRNPGSLLVLRAADCMPLIFYVPGEKFLALAHVGTSGAALHLPTKLVGMFNYPPERVHCYIGPHISQKAYRFPDRDISGKKLDGGWQEYITDEPDGVHLDLLGYVLNDLKQAGLKAGNIEVDEVDTGSNPDYFSHRRHKLTGEPNGRNCFAACLI